MNQTCDRCGPAVRVLAAKTTAAAVERVRALTAAAALNRKSTSTRLSATGSSVPP
jgi:hypothetical protein